MPLLDCQSKAALMHALLRHLAFCFAFLLVPALTASDHTIVRPDSESIVYFDLTPAYKLDLNDPAQRRRFWEECHLVFALQGVVNRSGPRLFVRFVSKPDDFWWEQMVQNGGWLSECKLIRLSSLDELLTR